MGFKDVKIDGYSMKTIGEEMNACNKKFFGAIFRVDETEPKGQFRLYEEAKNHFIKQQQEKYVGYFTKLGWDASGTRMRANDKEYIDFDIERNWLIFKTNKGDEQHFQIDVVSDFRDNPYYKKSRDGCHIVRVAPTPISVERQHDELVNLQKIIEYNDNLNGCYHFRIKLWTNHNAAGVEYADVDELLAYISETWF